MCKHIVFLKLFNMTQIQNFLFLKYFLLICLAINKMHAAPHDVYVKCMQQINVAFGGNITSSGCFRYAVEHYIKGQDLPITATEDMITDQDQNLAIHPINAVPFDELIYSEERDYPTPSEGSTAGSFFNTMAYELSYVDYPPPSEGSTSGSYYNTMDPTFYYDTSQDPMSNFLADPTVDFENYEDPMSHNIQSDCPMEDDNLNNLMPNVQEDEHKNVSSKEPPTKVFSFNDLVSNIEADPPTQVDNSIDLISNAQADQQSNDQNFDDLEDISLYVDSFEGLQDFILKDNMQNNVQSFDEQSVGQEAEPFQDINYANLYYKELEEMVYGSGIFTRPLFCNNYCKGLPGVVQFTSEYRSCLRDLWKFGNTQKEAAYTALTSYRLSECVDNHFVYEYMKSIIKGYRVRSPSKKPSSFCNGVWKRQF